MFARVRACSYGYLEKNCNKEQVAAEQVVAALAEHHEQPQPEEIRAHELHEMAQQIQSAQGQLQQYRQDLESLQEHPPRSDVPQHSPSTTRSRNDNMQMHAMRDSDEPAVTVHTQNPTQAKLAVEAYQQQQQPTEEAFQQQQQPTIHQFLADNHLAPEYATTLAGIGITEMSHCVDVTLEDLADFMKPMEARRFVRIAAQWTAANNDNGIVAL
jgi:hypothetical protein